MGSPWTEPAETVSAYMTQQVHKGYMDYTYSLANLTSLTEADSATLNDEVSYTPYQNQFFSSFASHRAGRKRKFQQNQCFQVEVPLGSGSDLVRIKKEYEEERDRYAFSWKNLPSWAIYFKDQRHRISNFSVQGNNILPNSLLNDRVSLCFEDNSIVQLQVDMVVTSTNETYSGKSGVDQLIHIEGGKELTEACKNLLQRQKLSCGNAEITPAGKLNARYVIHANGPQYNEDPGKLESCYENSLQLLLQYQLRTIAFPCISTGSKNFSKISAAEIALKTVRRFLESDNNRNKIDRIVFCLHSSKDVLIYRRFMQIYFPV